MGNNNSLFPQQYSNFSFLTKLGQSLLTNITIFLEHVAYEQRHKLCKERQIAGYSRVQTIHTMRLL